MQIPWVKRSDLSAMQHDSGGWVVKDPLTLNYVLLDDAEYAILNLLDGNTSLSNVQHGVQQRFPQRRLGVADIGEFLRSLAGHQLIRQTVPGDSDRLHSAGGKRSLARLIQLPLSLLRLQLPLSNPTKFLDRLLPKISPLFSRAAIVIGGVIFAVACLLTLLSVERLQAELPAVATLLGPANLPLLLGLFVVVKLFHELGHALTARRFGAECNEWGLILLVFTPVLYTDVTDAWTLSRRKRMLVTAAGILVELTIASICMLLLWFARDLVVRSILLNTILLCSINTLLFNGNPLLRFDGYFLLSDLLRLPNLAARSGAVMKDTILTWTTGFSVPHRETIRDRRILLLYGICAAAYRILLTVMILLLIRQMSRAWNAEFLGSFLSIMLVTGSVLVPLVKFFWSATSPQNLQQIEFRTLVRSGISIGILCFVLFYPFPRTIVAPAIIQPGGQPLFAMKSGRLQSAAEYGSSIATDAAVITLSNPELQRRRLQYASRVRELETRLMLVERNRSTPDAEILPTLREALAAAQTQLADVEKEFAKLTVQSGCSGIFLPPPSRAAVSTDELPKFWSGLPGEPRNTGAWIERGKLLGYVGDSWELTATVYVNAADIELLANDRGVRLLTLDGRSQPLVGTVESISRLPAQEVPLPLGVSGLIAGQVRDEHFAPAGSVYLATIVVQQPPNAESAPALFSTAHARIDVSSASVFSRFRRFFRQSF